MKHPDPRQCGAVLLLILLILVVVGSTIALSAMNNNSALRTQAQRELQQQMLRAKDALLAYATHSASLHGNWRGPGFFPCPDTNASDPDNDGIVSDDNATDCAGYDSTVAPLVGRLPIALDVAGQPYELTAHNAGIDQQLWYAVGNRYVSIATASEPVTPLRNSELRTSATLAYANAFRLTLDGKAGYVAMIIAPGAALDSQNRSAAPDDHNNYLDLHNGDGFAFISSAPGQVNDQLLGITLDEYMRAVGMRVAIEMKKELEEWYALNGSTSYPDSSGYVDFPQEPATAGSQDLFQSVFYSSAAASHIWLRNSGAPPPLQGNGEDWPSATRYQRVLDTQAQIVFAGCEGMIYTIDHTAAITRSGDSCQ